jgi:hypothetical protein
MPFLLEITTLHFRFTNLHEDMAKFALHQVLYAYLPYVITYLRLNSKSSLTLKEWRFNLSFP